MAFKKALPSGGGEIRPTGGFGKKSEFPGSRTSTRPQHWVASGRVSTAGHTGSVGAPRGGEIRPIGGSVPTGTGSVSSPGGRHFMPTSQGKQVTATGTQPVKSPGAGYFPPSKGKAGPKNGGTTGNASGLPASNRRIGEKTGPKNVPPVGGRRENVTHQNPNKKQAGAGGMAMNRGSYQHADYAKGYKHLGVIGSLPGSMPKQGASSNMSGGKSGKPKESPHGNRLPSNPHPPVRREGPGRAR